MYFTDEVFELKVEQTNLYTEKARTADPDKHKTPWSPVTPDELKSWLALTLKGNICLQIEFLCFFWGSFLLFNCQRASQVKTRGW